MSLLQPALTKAMYKASMVKCASNFKNIGVGLMIYADDNADFYPFWTDFLAPDTRSTARTGVRVPSHLGRGPKLRDIMLPYFGGTVASFGDTVVCPQVDSDEFWPTTHNGAYRAPNYYAMRMPINMYWSIYGGATIMKRVGNSWNWGKGEQTWYEKGPEEAVYYDYNILASDLLDGQWNNTIYSNHLPPGQVGTTEIYWGYKREPVSILDGNFLLDDGSVKYYDYIMSIPTTDSDFLRFYKGAYVPVELGVDIGTGP